MDVNFTISAPGVRSYKAMFGESMAYDLYAMNAAFCKRFVALYRTVGAVRNRYVCHVLGIHRLPQRC